MSCEGEMFHKVIEYEFEVGMLKVIVNLEVKNIIYARTHVRVSEWVRERETLNAFMLKLYDVIQVSSPQQIPVRTHFSLFTDELWFSASPFHTLPVTNLCHEGKALMCDA